MIYCIELNKEFETKELMFKALYAAKNDIIKLKKAAIQKSSDKGQISSKSFKVDATKALDVNDGYFYPVINTTKYLDHHLDVHMDGIWTKSLNENKGNLLYVNDHSLKIADVIAWNEDVTAFTKEISWQSIGKDYPGNTQALIFEIPKDKIVNTQSKEVIESKRAVQNSVRMQYVKIELAVDSTAKEYQTEKKSWDSNIDLIANKEVAEKNGYMWLVKEAKIEKEGSMVLFGSNDATPIISEPLKSTQDEPLKDTHKNNNLLNLM